jgi:competence protein ComEC
MLPSLTVAFTAGLLVGSQIPYFPLSTSCLLLFMALGAVPLERFKWLSVRQATWLYGALLVGVVYWAVAVNLAAHDSIGEYPSNSRIEWTGRIVAPVQQTPDRLIMVIRSDEPIDAAGASRHIRLTWHTPERVFFQGDRVSFRAMVRRPSGSLNPGGFDYAAYLERQGIDAVATVTGSEAVQFLESGRVHPWWAIWNQFDRWRSSIRLAAIQSLPQPALGLYVGIIIGDRGYLDPELREQFMVTGTVHLLSISGSHLGLVTLLIFAVVRWATLLLPEDWLLGLSRRIAPSRLAAGCTVLPVAGYACLAGAELATIRSLLMVAVGLIAIWMGQERRLFHALSAAAMGMLLHDPQALFDISFQLSFMSVIAIAGWLSWPVVAETEERPNNTSFLRSSVQWGKDSIVMSGVVTLVTIPLVAYYFNQLPWLGLLTNVVAVPVTGILLVPIGLAAGIWQIVIGGTVLPLASLNQWFLEHFVAAVRLVSTLPGGEWHVAAPSVFTMVLFYVCLVLLWQRAGKTMLRLAAGAGVLLVLLWWAWSPRMFLDGDHFRVTFLDVGQGDSAVVELPDGQVVLIDGGAAYEQFDMGRAVVAPFLWNRGIRAIDQVIGTHPQLDHVGGLAWVIRHFVVKHYWGSGHTREELFYKQVQQSLADQGVQEQVAREGQEIVSSGPCRLVVLNPPAEEPLDVPLHHSHVGGHVLNNHSVVTRLTCGPHTILFAADIEQDGLSRMTRTPSHAHGPIAVLKVPHHGAVSSLNREWLTSLQPRYAVFSAGRHNRYTHPAAAVLDAYGAVGSTVLRTDRDGGVWFTGGVSGSAIHVHRTRDLVWQPTHSVSCLWTCEQANLARIWKHWWDGQ